MYSFGESETHFATLVDRARRSTVTATAPMSDQISVPGAAGINIEGTVPNHGMTLCCTLYEVYTREELDSNGASGKCMICKRYIYYCQQEMLYFTMLVLTCRTMLEKPNPPMEDDDLEGGGGVRRDL